MVLFYLMSFVLFATVKCNNKLKKKVFNIQQLINPEVAGSSPALVNFSLFIQIYLKSVPSQFPLWFIT